MQEMGEFSLLEEVLLVFEVQGLNIEWHTKVAAVIQKSIYLQQTAGKYI